MEVLVVGGCGFVGGYLIDELPKKGCLVIDTDKEIGKVLFKKGISYLSVDITKKKILACVKLPRIKCVVNLASLQPDYVANPDQDPTRYINTNTIGTINLLEYCIENNISQYIHLVSHRSVMGHGCMVSEGMPYKIDYNSPFAPFAISEVAAVETIELYRQRFGLKAIILRVPSIIGFGSHLEGYQNGVYRKTGLATFIDNAKAGKIMTIYGDPLNGRDVVYVKDVVSAILAAINSRSSGGLFNISSGKILTLEEEVKTIVNVFSDGSIPYWNYDTSTPNDIEWCLYDIKKARKELNWVPDYPDFEDMMIDFKEAEESHCYDYLINGRKAKAGK